LMKRFNVEKEKAGRRENIFFCWLMEKILVYLSLK